MTDTNRQHPVADRIAALAQDAGMSVAELAAASGIEDYPWDKSPSFAERVAAGEAVSSLEVALIAGFTGRDPMWLITGDGPLQQLDRMLAEYGEQDLSTRMGINQALNALRPFLPAHIVARVDDGLRTSCTTQGDDGGRVIDADEQLRRRTERRLGGLLESAEQSGSRDTP